MICPRCGRQVEGLACRNCGFSIIEAAVCLIGSDTKSQIHTVCEQIESVIRSEQERMLANKKEAEAFKRRQTEKEAQQRSEIHLLKQQAADGDISAQIELGDRYIKGNGLEQNTHLAITWYRKAAEAGSEIGRRKFDESCQEELEVRIGERISQGLSIEKLNAFDLIKDSAEVARWLEVNRPDYKEIIEEEHNRMKQDFGYITPLTSVNNRKNDYHDDGSKLLDSANIKANLNASATRDTEKGAASNNRHEQHYKASSRRDEANVSDSSIEEDNTLRDALREVTMRSERGTRFWFSIPFIINIVAFFTVFGISLKGCQGVLVSILSVAAFIIVLEGVIISAFDAITIINNPYPAIHKIIALLVRLLFLIPPVYLMIKYGAQALVVSSPNVALLVMSGLLFVAVSLCMSLWDYNRNARYKPIYIVAAFVMVASFIALAYHYSFVSDIYNKAWGPEDRATFTWDNPAGYAAFNSITDNPAIGDERNFVRVKLVGSDDPHLDEAVLEAGKEYEIYVYYHNNASSATGEKGIAHDVSLTIMAPFKLNKGETGVVKGIIRSSDSKPKSVWDSAYLNATEDIELYYVKDSAVIHSYGETDGDVLDAELLFGEKGVPFSPSKDAPGEIPSTEEGSRGYITLRLQAVAKSTE